MSLRPSKEEHNTYESSSITAAAAAATTRIMIPTGAPLASSSKLHHPPPPPPPYHHHHHHAHELQQTAAQPDQDTESLRKATRAFLSITIFALFIASNIGVYVSGVLAPPIAGAADSWGKVTVTVGGQPAVVRGGKVYAADDMSSVGAPLVGSSSSTLSSSLLVSKSLTSRTTACNDVSASRLQLLLLAEESRQDPIRHARDRELLSYFQGLCGGTFLQINIGGGIGGGGGGQGNNNTATTTTASLTRVLSQELHWKILNVPTTDKVAATSLPQVGGGSGGGGNAAFVDVLYLDASHGNAEWYHVLQSIPWSTTTFGLVLVETAQGPSSRRQVASVMTLLDRQGYLALGDRGTTSSLWFLNRSFDTIYTKVT